MSRPPATNRAAVAARNRLERARASCQELLQELGTEHIKPYSGEIGRNGLGSSHDEVIS